eukprot:7031142-Prymnesium_polylepis.1
MSTWQPASQARLGSMGLTETIDLALVSRGRLAAKVVGLALFAAAACVEAAVVVCLREAPALVHAVNHSDIEWKFFSLIDALGDFENDTVDVILVYLIRLFATGLLTCIAVVVGRPQLDDLVEEAEAAAGVEPLVVDDGGGAAPLLINGGCCANHGGGGTAPLLINGGCCGVHGGSGDTAPPVDEGGGGDDGDSAAAAAPRKPTTSARGEHLESFQRKKAADVRKNLAIAALFAVSTAAQVFVGIKCISFHGAWHDSSAAMTLQGALLGTSVVLINAEAWLANRIVHALTAEVTGSGDPSPPTGWPLLCGLFRTVRPAPSSVPSALRPL